MAINKFYRLTYKNGSVTFVQARNVKHLAEKADRQTSTKNVKAVHRMNAAETGYIKVKNPFK